MAQDPTSIIDQLYQQYGLQDSGRGSGFADRAYWLEHPSEILNGRLAQDLAGSGPDQPTGTPGVGPWQKSGQNYTGGDPSSTPNAWSSGRKILQSLGVGLPGVPSPGTQGITDPTAKIGANSPGFLAGDQVDQLLNSDPYGAMLRSNVMDGLGQPTNLAE